ncbi:hypothetical protein LIER_05402 [Lithospermum erythrorhizon]|uniref:Uncharacterized protein n=1 Tax=Lithospermum erythrorhizon TaxID=34254 RepID=A0AAV3P0Y0_LITER
MNRRFDKDMSGSPDGPPNITGRVNIICRGRSGVGDSRSGRRAYAKRDIYAVSAGSRPEFPDLSFFRSDFDGQNDPLKIHCADQTGWHSIGRVHRRYSESHEGRQPHGYNGEAPTIGHEDGRVHYCRHGGRSL